MPLRLWNTSTRHHHDDDLCVRDREDEMAKTTRRPLHSNTVVFEVKQELIAALPSKLIVLRMRAEKNSEMQNNRGSAFSHADEPLTLRNVT